MALVCPRCKSAWPAYSHLVEFCKACMTDEELTQLLSKLDRRINDLEAENANLRADLRRGGNTGTSNWNG